MKQTWIHFILLTILFLILLPWLPWWGIFVVPFILGLVWHHRSRTTLLISLLSGWIVWMVWAAYLSIENNHIMARRIGDLLGHLPGGILPIISGFIGGVYAAVGGYLGQSIKNKVSSKPK